MDLLSRRMFMGGGVQFPQVLQTGVAAADNITFSSTPSSGTLILFFGMRGGSDVSLPSGYTLIAQRTGGNARLHCSYKVSNGAETSVTSTNAGCVAYAFITPSAILDVTGTVATSANNLVEPTSITPANNSLVFSFNTQNDNAAAATAVLTGGWTKLIDSAASVSSSVELCLNRLTNISNGSATGNCQTVFDGTGPSAGVLFSVKLP